MVEEKVREGYKSTVVGVIPEDWVILKLDDVCTSINDGTHHTPKYVEDGIPFYSVENITDNNFTSTKYISQEEHLKLIRRCLPEKGDILMTRIGTLAKTKLINWDVNASIYVSLALLKMNKKIYSKYFYEYSKSSRFVESVEKRSLMNATPKKINMGEINEIPIPLPPIKEQKSIANVLSDTDELITSLQKLIDKKEKIKKGAMQKLLTGEKRLPGFDGEWEETELGELYTITAGGDLDKDSFSKNKTNTFCYPIYSNGLTKKGLYGYSSKYIYDGNKVTVTARGTIGCANYRKIKFCAIGRLLILSPNIEINNFLISEIINTLIEFKLESTGVPQLTAPKIRGYKIRIPKDIKEQKAIAQILSDMDNEIEALNKKLNKYKKIKQGMMEELLTGRIRLI
ncbi:MAG: restriction endonuclease subunit S [Bacillota bacterium]|nr:restriction endonuclease subunit S [Bacillota bacterium]